ncbi:hypothetical protein FRC07_004549, partial [Ceratobasidium sp. 392]
MGQNASQSSTQDAIKPESISGPMPLSRVRSPSRARSNSGEDGRRLRRERRRSRDHAGSTPTSPIVDSPSASSGRITSSIPEITRSSTPRSQNSQPQVAQIRATRRRSSVTTTATAPPPYTAEPASLEVQLAEAPPPPVPPRERDNSNAARRRSTVEKPPVEWQDEPGRHRRTMSHSIAGSSSRTSTSPQPIRAASPPIAGGARARGREMPPLLSSSPPSAWFRAQMPSPPALEEEFSLAGGTPGIYSPYQSRSNTQQLAPVRTRESADYNALSPRAPPSRRGSREDPLEMLRRYKTVMIVDDSSSMEGESWAEARDALAGLADAAAKYDQDGID